MADADNFEVETLLMEIENKPCLWDRNYDGYRNKQERKVAWSEICSALFSEFENWSEQEKQSAELRIMSRWKNIKDAHIKSCKQHGMTTLGRRRKKKYVYSQYLQFLPKDVGDDFASTSFSTTDTTTNKSEGPNLSYDDDSHATKFLETLLQPSGISDENIEFGLEVDAVDYASSQVEKSLLPSSNQQSPARERLILDMKKKKLSKKTNTIECQTIPVVNGGKDKRVVGNKDDRAFFESLLPSLKVLDTDEKIEFRLEMMKLVKQARQSHFVNNPKRLKKQHLGQSVGRNTRSKVEASFQQWYSVMKFHNDQ